MLKLAKLSSRFSSILQDLVGLMSSRNNVVEMPSQVPAGMADWVDSMVLLCVSLADSEFCAQLRQFHSVCSNSGDEKNYELVPPSSDKRVYFSTRVVDGRPFFYVYDFFFGPLGITLPFTQFETDLLWSCNIAPLSTSP
ncbi:uncharacterized protein LOC130960493 [Arachis stenosperma]|uniref:uncharacterized protein LOC130960493 n=1 Tax=Arachis stenosperma TaxID=217475 RepID=UPI0025AD826C|nr:uncharacterized protein LOC130960493 [Arachis stenosperma]